HNWSIKHVHRLILNSATYRQASEIRARARPSSSSSVSVAVEHEHEDERRARATNPANKLLWHFPQRRLEAEVVRDTMLQLSGQQTLHRRQTLRQNVPAPPSSGSQGSRFFFPPPPTGGVAGVARPFRLPARTDYTA